MWNKDEMQGKAKEIKGSIKDKFGEVTNDPNTEAEGEAERTEGKVQHGFGTARRKAGEVVEDIGKTIAGNK